MIIRVNIQSSEDALRFQHLFHLFGYVWSSNGGELHRDFEIIRSYEGSYPFPQCWWLAPDYKTVTYGPGSPNTVSTEEALKLVRI